MKGCKVKRLEPDQYLDSIELQRDELKCGLTIISQVQQSLSENMSLRQRVNELEERVAEVEATSEARRVSVELWTRRETVVKAKLEKAQELYRAYDAYDALRSLGTTYRFVTYCHLNMTSLMAK